MSNRLTLSNFGANIILTFILSKIVSNCHSDVGAVKTVIFIIKSVKIMYKCHFDV